MKSPRIWASSRRRAVTFLARVGGDAYELFQPMMMEFAEEGDRKKIEAFQRHRVGKVKTYESCVLNRRVQEMWEPFDAFVADVGLLARSWEHAALEDSIIRDVANQMRWTADRRWNLITLSWVKQIDSNRCRM